MPELENWHVTPSSVLRWTVQIRRLHLAVSAVHVAATTVWTRVTSESPTVRRRLSECHCHPVETKFFTSSLRPLATAATKDAALPPPRRHRVTSTRGRKATPGIRLRSPLQWRELRTFARLLSFLSVSLRLFFRFYNFWIFYCFVFTWLLFNMFLMLKHTSLTKFANLLIFDLLKCKWAVRLIVSKNLRSCKPKPEERYCSSSFPDIVSWLFCVFLTSWHCSGPWDSISYLKFRLE